MPTNFQSHPLHCHHPNEVVYFKVTNIEYDVMSRPVSSLQDAYTGSTLGELGCWVDSSVTRMVQTGVEHTRVPDARMYSQLGGFLVISFFGCISCYFHVVTLDALSTLQSLRSLHLLGPQSPFVKLLALTSAALSQKAVDYRLNLTFLMKGGRGSGKFTVASWVAQRLGLHAFEVCK